MKKIKAFLKKFNSLAFKIIVSIILLTLIISTVLVYISYNTYKNTMNEHYETLGNNIAETAMSMLEDDAVKAYVEKMHNTDPEDISTVASVMAETGYQEIIEVLHNIRVSNDVTYLYMAKFDETNAHFVFDADKNPDTQYTFAYSLPFAGSDWEPLADDFVAGNKIPARSVEDDLGWLMSVFVPYFHGETKELLGYMAVDIHMNEVVQDRQDYLKNCVIVLSVVTAVFAALYVVVFNLMYVKPIKKMAVATSEFVSARSDGETHASPISRLSVKTGDELQLLCDSMKQMEVDLVKHIEDLRNVTAERERIGAELDVATKIQASMLPCIFPAFPDRKEFDIYATMNPAKEVGGDFYDFFMVDEDNLAIVMADVSGKGVPAALFMVIGKTLLKDHTTSGRDLGEVFSEVNRLLCEANSEELFITAFVGVLNLKTGEFRYVNAGHEIPFIAKKNEAFKPYKIRAGFVLAGMEGIKYKAGSMQLEPGDKIFQYTDGVTEATDKDNRLYGMDRLEKTLATLAQNTPEEILKGIKADIDLFVGDAPQFDDITMLCVDFKSYKSEIAEEEGKRVRVSADETAPLTEYVEEVLNEGGASMGTVVKMNIALDEIFSNIVKFSGASYARVICKVEDGVATLILEDDGLEYNPLDKEDPDITLSAEERDIGGLGILMVKKSMDSVEYKRDAGKNILTLRKKA